MSWIIRLRWSSIVGQIGTIVAVYGVLGVRVPLLPLGIIIGLEVLANLLSSMWARKARRVALNSEAKAPVLVKEWHLAALMALDVVFLTGLLFFTGGPFNPFAFLYLVNIALAAVVLHAQWTWMLVGFALLSLGLLPLLNYHPLPLESFDPDTRAEFLQRGVWVAFGVASVFIVHFLLRVIGALEARERELKTAQKQADKQARLASLATMAAGAAHELSTPLATIAVVAKEIARRLGEDDARMTDDVQLVRDEVGRCRHILSQMAGGMGHGDATHLEVVTLEALVDSALVGIRKKPDVRLEIDEPAKHTALPVPLPAAEQALRSLITNAQDASPGNKAVHLFAERDDDILRIMVKDQGEGMNEKVIARLGEPFYTTKEPGYGMGLGFFLARTVFERLNGEILVDSRAGLGTCVEILLPIAQPSISQGPNRSPRQGEREEKNDKHGKKREHAA